MEWGRGMKGELDIDPEKVSRLSQLYSLNIRSLIFIKPSRFSLQARNSPLWTAIHEKKEMAEIFALLF